MLGPNLATCQLAARDENAVKLELKLSDENGRRKQTKTRWGWGGKHNRNDMENPGVRSCGEKKKRKCK